MSILGGGRIVPSDVSPSVDRVTLTIARAAHRLISEFWESAAWWRRTAIVLGVTGLALLVAALIAREPPDFADGAIIAVLRDRGRHPGWTVRLARAAHQIAVDGLGVAAPPAGKDYQLWLVTPGQATQPLGLLPTSGRKIFAETPANIRRFGGTAELQVTLEAVTGSLARVPNGPVVFHANIGARE